MPGNCLDTTDNTCKTCTIEKCKRCEAKKLDDNNPLK